MRLCIPRYAKSDMTLCTAVHKISVYGNMNHIVRPPVISSIKAAFSLSCVMVDCSFFFAISSYDFSLSSGQPLAWGIF